MEDPRYERKESTQASKQRAEDVLEELHQLAGDVAAVLDSRDPEENRALESFEQVMDALEDKVN